MRAPSDDRRWMRLAVREASKGIGATSPNPPVGACIVRNGRLLSCGYHHAAGMPHAEIEAFNACRENPEGATLYVTLEPCSTSGRTPPCTSRVIASGIKRVVAGSVDPNPKHAGRGLDLLKAAGIEVRCGVRGVDTDFLIEKFSKLICAGKPFVTLKMAQSLDGAIADYSGKSKWISSEESRNAVKELRNTADAVMVGAGTAVADNPSLLGERNFRLILDSSGRTPSGSKIFTDGNAARTVVAVTSACPAARIEEITASGARVWTLPSDAGGKIDLPALMTRCGEEGWMHVLCEGGAELAGSLAARNLADEIIIFIAPVILGRRAASSFGNAEIPLPSAPRYRIVSSVPSGPDIKLTLRPAPEPQ